MGPSRPRALPSEADSGMPRVTLRSPSGEACVVFTHGAHVASWTDADGGENLFTSEAAVFKPPKALRGGVPVCWPQFGGVGDLQAHGFARNSEWAVKVQTDDQVVMTLKSNDETRAMWPHDFELQLTVKLGGSGSAASATSGVLKTTLAVLNTGDAPFSFTAALHTYFGVADIAKTRVLGLKGVPYHDGNVPDKSALAGRKRFDGDDADTINFDGEFDRIYCGAPDWLTIEDEAGGRAIGVEKHGLPDAVVWNPHVAKSARMGDFGDDEWKRMVCVEPAAVENAVELKPGAAWTGQQVIKVMPIDAKRTGFP